MSQWTHVSGLFRVDGFLGMGRESEIRRAFGVPSSRDYGADPYESGHDIPGGSEGTIQYEVTHAGDGLVWKTVAVWGDLRDFGADDTAEIDAWFSRIVASGLMLRAAHLLVEVEHGTRYLLVAKDGTAHRVALESEAGR